MQLGGVALGSADAHHLAALPDYQRVTVDHSLLLTLGQLFGTEGGNVPVATLPTATPFALLEDNSGDRIKIGYQNGGWTGANLDGIGWVDKDSVLVNLPE